MAIQNITGEDKQHAELLRLLQAMGEIRHGEENGNAELQKRDTYLGLSKELGELLTSIPTIKDQLNGLVAIADKGEYPNYDPYFIDSWERVAPDLTSRLESLTVQVKGDDFSGFEETIHIWNAMKYLATVGKPMNERIRVFDTILPVFPSRDLQGFDINGKVADPDKVYLGRYRGDLMEVLDRAGVIGFKTARVEVDLNNLDDYKHDVIRIGTRITQDEGKKKTLLQRLYNPITKILIDIFIGGLPVRIQESIAQKFLEKGVELDPYKCSKYNIIAEELASAVAAVVCPLTIAIWTVGPTAGYLLFNLWMRRSYNNDERGVGSPLLKLPLLPVELAMRYNERKEKNGEKVRPANWALYEVKLSRSFPRKRNLTQNARNLHKDAEKMGAKKIDERLEENLLYSEKSHNTQGSLFKSGFAAEMFEFGQGELFRELSAMAIYNVDRCCNYSKISAFVCYQNRRYAVTLITNSDFKPQELPKLLVDSAKPIEERIEGLAKSSNAIYAHVTQFEKCQKTADLVWRQG